MKKTNKKRYFFILVVAVIFITTIVLGMLSEKILYNRMIDKIEERYGVEFEFVRSNDFTEPGHTVIFVKTDSLPNKEIAIKYSEDADEKYRYEDNYLSYLYWGEVEKMIQSSIEEVYGKGKVIYDVSGMLFPEGFNLETTLEEFLEYDGEKNISIILDETVPLESRKEDIEEFRGKLEEKSIAVSAMIVYTKNGSYEKINKSNVNEVFLDNERASQTGGLMSYRDGDSIIHWN